MEKPFARFAVLAAAVYLLSTGTVPLLGQTKQYRTNNSRGTNINSSRGRDPFTPRPNNAGQGGGIFVPSANLGLTYTSNTVINVGIGLLATTQSTIRVEEKFQFRAIAVNVKISHEDMDDIIISLLKRNTNGVLLGSAVLHDVPETGIDTFKYSTDPAGPAGNFALLDPANDVTFTMSATRSIFSHYTLAAEVVTTNVVGAVTNIIHDRTLQGEFLPTSTLNALTNLSTEGDWSLEYSDKFGNNFGTQTQWSVIFTITSASSFTPGSGIGTNITPRETSESGAASTNLTRSQSER